MTRSRHTTHTKIGLPRRRWSAPARLTLAAVLMAMWLLFSGRYDAFHVGAGVVSVVLVLTINRNLFQVRLFPGDEPRRLHPLRVLVYFPWLVGQMVSAAIGVARVVLSPRMPLHPGLVGLHADLPNPTAQSILANSITLTPGTITVAADRGVFLVHTLTDDACRSLIAGRMSRRVAGLFQGDETGDVSAVTIQQEPSP